MKILADWSGWNQFLEIGFTDMFLVLSFLLIVIFKYSLTKKWELTDVILPLLFFNLFQWENLIGGMLMAFVLPLFFFCLWLWLLKIENLRKRYVFMTFLSLLSAFSSLHGLVLPFLTTSLVLFEYFKFKIGNFKLTTFTVLTNVLIVGSYFISFLGLNIRQEIPLFSFLGVIKFAELLSHF